VTHHHQWEEERDLRNSYHVSLDESLRGVVPRTVTPSRDLYGGALDNVVASWNNRWWTARLIELGFLPISVLLDPLGRGISCRRRGGPSAATILSWVVGARIHKRIQRAYRVAYHDDAVSVDNRVHAGLLDESGERLSNLATRNPASVYGALNFCLAGQRSDIINVSSKEMWEIKPASLASKATLQLWGYLDNYEVARVFERYARGGRLSPIVPGNPATLNPIVTREFLLTLPRTPIKLLVRPFTSPRLPGLILYTLRVPGPRPSSDAAAAVAVGRVRLGQHLRVGQRTAREQQEAEEAFWESATYVATGVAVTCAALDAELLVGAAILGVPAMEAALGLGGAGAVGAGGAVTAEEVAASQQLAKVIPISQARARVAAAAPELAEVVKQAPAAAATVATVVIGAKQMDLFPETVGPAIETGMEVGVASGTSPP
jgi:hypothetical protein